TPRRVTSERTAADRAFRFVTTGAGLVTLVILFLIGLFLFLQALPTFHQNGLSFFTTRSWNPDVPHQTGVAALVFGTLVVAGLAMVMSIPVSLLTAVYLTEYVPYRLRGPLVTVVDLLAAIPSLMYGIWGFFVLQPHLLGLSQWLADHLGFIPIFATSPTASLAASPFIASVLVALMLLPTATSIMREVFAQTPPGEKEAALALGGSRWRMVRTVVLPFGRGGIVGGAMLALGRAMGESISIAIILAAAFNISPRVLETGGNTIGAHIANRFADADKAFGLPALMGAALVLYLMTLVVNTGASLVVRRSRSGQGVEI
ncbi:MAG: phosphate ABC transporter permease subunit PstC, partial [Motilibacteraceae bacterium]